MTIYREDVITCINEMQYAIDESSRLQHLSHTVTRSYAPDTPEKQLAMRLGLGLHNLSHHHETKASLITNDLRYLNNTVAKALGLKGTRTREEPIYDIAYLRKLAAKLPSKAEVAA